MRDSACRAGDRARAGGRGDLAGVIGAIAVGFTEIFRVPAIGGKTWNHPVPAGDVLLVRNGEEMAASG